MEPGQRLKAFLPKFEHDIFLSYRHIRKPDEWLEKLHECLRTELVARLNSVDIWRDRLDLRAGDEWREEIEKALSSAAIFLAVVTETYFDSPVCAHEFDLYVGRRMGAAAGATRGVVIPVLRHKFDVLPDDFEPFQAVNFCDPITGREYHESLAEDPRGGFYTAVGELALILRERLRDLAGAIRAQMPAIFLAETGFPEHERRQTVRRELLQRDDLVVLPARPYRWNLPSLELNINTDLDRAELCVHVVPPGLDAEGERKVRRQLEMAVSMMQTRARPMPLVWVPSAPPGLRDPNGLIAWVTNELPKLGLQFIQGDSYKRFKEDLDELLAERGLPSDLTRHASESKP
jgi:hypothetical protein